MNIYTKLALEIIAELGGYRFDVERAAANDNQIDFWIYLRCGSDRYVEVISWGLDTEGRRALDCAIQVELRRQGILGSYSSE